MNILNFIDWIAIIFFGGSILLLGIAALVFLMLVASTREDKFY